MSANLVTDICKRGLEITRDLEREINLARLCVALARAGVPEEFWRYA